MISLVFRALVVLAPYVKKELMLKHSLAILFLFSPLPLEQKLLFRQNNAGNPDFKAGVRETVCSR